MRRSLPSPSASASSPRPPDPRRSAASPRRRRAPVRHGHWQRLRAAPRRAARSAARAPRAPPPRAAAGVPPSCGIRAIATVVIAASLRPPRPIVTASNGTSGWAARQRQQPDPGRESLARAAAASSRRRSSDWPWTPPTVPVSRIPFGQVDVGLLERAGSLPARRARPARSAIALAVGPGWLDHRRAERPGRQRPAGDLGQRGARAGRCPASTRVQQALADAPALEAVELDRQRVVDLVLVAPIADARGAGAGTRAPGAATNATSSSSATQVGARAAAAAAPAGTRAARSARTR